MKLRSLLLPCLALFASAGLGWAATPASAAPAWAPALEKAAAELPAGGFVYAEIDGATVRYGTAGRAAGPDGIAPERVLFEIGSITKVFTGLLLAQATLDGKMALDDPIAKHLPADLPLDPSVAAITLQQLSSHTSGLPRLPDNLAPAQAADPYADYTVERLYAFLRGHRLAKAAPQPAAYSNLGVGLLGHLLARAYGLSYAELVRAKITGPLGMHDTTIALEAGQQVRFAHPHSGTQAVPAWNFDALAGAGALRSTAADLILFARALLDEGSPIAPAWRIAREPRAPLGPDVQVGLGIMLAARDGRAVFTHGGGTGGTRAHLEIVPAPGQATVVLLNNDNVDPGAIVARARQKDSAAAASPSAAPTEIPLAADEARAFAGVYEIDANGRFTVVLDAEGRLHIRLTGQAFLPVGFLGQDRFFAKGVAAQFQFARGADGRVSAVTLHQNGREISARRTGDAPTVLFPPREKLRDYEGVYALAPGLVFEVRATARALVVKLTGQPAIPVHATRPDHFVYDVVDAALTFERGPDGSVTALVLHQNGLDQRAPKQPPAAGK